MRRLALAIALLLGGSAAGVAARIAEDQPIFMTGAEPIAHADYDRLPKLGKFRAWLPKKVDLSEAFPKPGYQGPEPNCVAWATTYAARSFLYGKELGHQPGGPAEQMSPAYVYNRLRPAGSMCDRSIRIVDALNMLKTEGVVSLADFPDDLRSCPVPAPMTLREKAGAFRLASWRAIDREHPGDWHTPVILDDIKGALARGNPVVFAMPLPGDWAAFKGDGVYVHQEPAATNYHAMALVGYDEDRQAFRLINSWGRGWGDHGYAWIAYDTFKLLAGEAYVLEGGGGGGGGGKPTAPSLSPQQSFDAQVAAMPCGAVSTARQDGHLLVSGFAGGQDSLTALRSAALALDPGARWAVALNAWPQCEAQLTLARPLAVGTVALSALTEGNAARSGDPVPMRAGERFGLAVETTAARPYLSLVYLQADGSAVELYRGAPAPDARGRRLVTIGTGGATATRFQVTAPYGDEIVIALASGQPLFGREIETYATERQFLTGLRARLTTAPAGSVGAAVLRIRTRE